MQMGDRPDQPVGILNGRDPVQFRLEGLEPVARPEGPDDVLELGNQRRRERLLVGRDWSCLDTGRASK